jgi:ribosomal protein S10
MKATNCRCFSQRVKAFEAILNKAKAKQQPIQRTAPEPTENEYVKLIRRMQSMKQDDNRELTYEEVKGIMRDIEIEESDEEFAEAN